MTLLQLRIEVVGIGVAGIYLLGMLPVEVVEFYLYEVPLILVVLGEEVVEYLNVTMIRETEVAYATCRTLFHKEVKDAIIDITPVEVIHTTHANAMEQVIVDIIDTQGLHGVVVHLL